MHSLRALVLILAAAGTMIGAGSAIAAPPSNDNLTAAAELLGRVDFAEGTNVDATKESGEPNHAGSPGGASIWYRWTAPAAGRTTVSTCGTEFDTLLAIYRGVGSVQFLTEVASNNDACGKQSRVDFQAVSGETYFIAVDGADGATGVVWLSLNLAPLNDDFADAQELAGDTGSANGTTIGSSSEDWEPDHLGLAWNSVWFEWTPASTGWATFENCGSPLDSVIAVYTGPDADQLQLVAGNDDACALASRVSFQAVAGTAYMIAIAGYGGDVGDFTVRWNRNPPPPAMTQGPRVLGLARDGETLTASEGVWVSDPPATYTYAWGRCDRQADNCEFVQGAGSKTYVLTSADVGFRLWVRVTATNPYGSTAGFTDLTAPVSARPPSNTSSPVVDGDARLGAILVASPGSWTGTAPISYAYQWQACDATATICTDIPGQTGQVMRVTSVELGDLLRVVVTASNVAGSASASSPGTDVERAVLTTRRRCVVPNVRGKTLRAARASIKRNHCRVGRVRRIFSGRTKAGRVVSQTPRAGRRLPVGARINVVLSKGKRR